MTSLRTMWGCDLKYIEANFGADKITLIEEKAQNFIDSGRMEKENSILALTDEGRLFADGIAAELFID